MAIDRGHGIATSAVLADSYDLDALITDTEAAKVAALAAQTAAETAETNAETAETNASASASAASTSASNATAAQTAAASSATAASASETAAGTSETNAASSETAAAASQTAAATSETNAATSAAAAAASESAAGTSSSNAAQSATNASNSATSASTSATNASGSALSASNSASAASTSETNAAASETSAALSETNASSSASQASTSASQASTSASSASNSATAAATSETNAAASYDAFDDRFLGAKLSDPATDNDGNALQTGAMYSNTTTNEMRIYNGTSWDAPTTQASTSATNAATSETNAAASETNAATSATNAATSETNAATSETNAATSATNASTSETNAATSESNAATSATNASNSATSATTAQTAAEAARDSALAAFDSFDDRYLGQKASDPATDNDGNALQAGTLYFNTTADEMKVYEGTSWVAAYASLSGALLVANNLSDLNNAATARTNLGVALGTDVQAYSAVLAGTTASYTTAEETKLAGIETGATADQTKADIDALNIDADTVDGQHASAFATAGHNHDATYVNASGDTMTGNLSLGDSIKALFGASSDLQIYHDGANSIINETGTGVLEIRTNGAEVQITGNSGTDYCARFISNGAVNLYHDNSQKLATTATGVDVTGEIVCDNQISINGGTGYGNIEIGGDSGAYIDLKNPASDDYDVRLITTGTGVSLTTNTGVGAVNLQHENATKLATTSTGVSVTGNITATGTIDGRDVATDGAKLDGIEASANNYSHPTGDGNLHVPATGTTNNGKVLTAGATAGSLSWAEAASGGARPTVQVFTSGGTWTKPADLKGIKVTVTGGGGGGGNNMTVGGRGGGGAGGTAIEWIDASALGATESVTVGGGGGGGYQYDPGGNGGSSSFGAHCSASGGTGGSTSTTNFTAGGTGSGGSINIDGAHGGGGNFNEPADGGGSYWGGPGHGWGNTSSGPEAVSYGSGGGGGSGSQGAGNGKSGVVLVEQYF